MASDTRIYHIIVDCPTWGHVERFCDTRLANQKSIRVETDRPLAMGQAVIVALQLPNQLVVAIDGTVLRTLHSTEGQRYEISYVGTVDEVVRRIRAFIGDARGEESVEQTNPKIYPVPTAQDVPIDELVPGRGQGAVQPQHQSAFMELEKTFRKLRSLSARQVLQLPEEFDDTDVRKALSKRVFQFHPDNFAYYGSNAIRRISEDICAFINRAAERLFLRSEKLSKAVPLEGWLIQDNRRPRRSRTLPPILLTSSTIGSTVDSDQIEDDASLSLLEQQQNVLTRLQNEPKNRVVRAQYHFVTAQISHSEGHGDEAVRQANLALTYLPDYSEALSLLTELEESP